MPDDPAAIFARDSAAEATSVEPRGKAYVVPCPSGFRDRVIALAARRRVSAGDLARAVLLLLPAEALAKIPDPGEPTPDDREVVALRSGPSKGRVLRRKPRLQVRLPAGHAMSDMRRALSLALDLAAGEQEIALETDADRQAKAESGRASERLTEEVESLHKTIATIRLRPLENGVTSRGDALHVLGLSPFGMPDRASIRARYRQLARVYHPDAQFGDHVLMSQINEALERLIPF
ncbi:MAG: J domain-containing protein [Alphaproteobacteria bacterium]|nr:J domain-containing protein [Alphaproteobacteria bacterium]